MPIIFNLLAKTCGLSLPEVAKAFRTPMDTVKAWSSGRRSCPEDVLRSLWHLAQINESQARKHAARLRRLKTPINLDEIPRSGAALGVHHAMLGRIVALLPDETEYE